jgi:YesN/AraC family two-component response regulator
VVRTGLHQLLEAQPNWEIVGEATNGREAVTKAVETKPDVAIIDFRCRCSTGSK